MSVACQPDLTDLNAVYLSARCAERTCFRGRQALRLDGLALLPACRLGDGTLRVEITTEGAAYPGLVFRAADNLNHELVYAQPHTSGMWDAIQYDPVFRGSNSWQIYHGPAYQQSACIPTGRWFALTVSFSGNRASASVDDQPPLIVENLAHGVSSGYVGLWSYLPAYFRDLSISSEATITVTGQHAHSPYSGGWQGIDSWFLQGYGVAQCSEGLMLHLNRHLPPELRSATAIRRFRLAEEAKVSFVVGYSDLIELFVDGQLLYRGENRFADDTSGRRDRRGYVVPEHRVSTVLAKGEHTLSAIVGVQEPFGWGLTVGISARGLVLLPPGLP